MTHTRVKKVFHRFRSDPEEVNLQYSIDGRKAGSVHQDSILEDGMSLVYHTHSA